MPTLAQLQAESWWGRETIPPNLAALRTRLLNHWKLSGSAIGIKGDANHLRGYHRSREWIKNSKYATNRSYSVSETPGNRAGGDSRWIAAMDITLPRDLLIQVCQRLDAAVRAGRLEKITEWYGNKDGDSRVDGYDNIRNAVATSDSSHLWHLHMSFDRGRVNDNHDDVFAVLTGTATEGGDDMYCKYGDSGFKVWELQAGLAELGFDPGPIDGKYGDKTAAALVKAGLVGGDKTGKTYGAYEHYHLQKRLQETRARKVVEAAVAQIRDSLPSGSPGLPTRVVITGELRAAE
ncbi:MAG: peptidoglycan-binding protein [Micromonosporaceae bacterium]|nr:peptidoglycan-binding protein [Micromonosporaceae bacterium]